MKKINASSGIRSHDLTDDRQVSYPLSYEYTGERRWTSCIY